MPTGYTVDVADGKITTLREFALTCARGMGALVMMRDMPMDAPIPERFEPSDFYAKERDKAQAKLAALLAMTPDEWRAAADAELAGRKERAANYSIEKAEQRKRYDAMIGQVSEWQGAPEGLKEFMLDQLHQSRDFDCLEGETWYESLEPMTGAEWHEKRSNELASKVSRYTAEYQAEVERTDARNAWVAQLRASLEDYEPA